MKPIVCGVLCGLIGTACAVLLWPITGLHGQIAALIWGAVCGLVGSQVGVIIGLVWEQFEVK